ncbi:response regulator [Hephaestia sp. GCM10023244]|uniref:response regulator n=1 Tax=unclassified Hephaestia TaxID=2631281 RepID=UPI0020776E1D|nr:response regulator [Hephaestia sp. MAHUQ-44]MCM8731277.1 response regulator [Hephaestia sp. MAHUQ-44]
MERFDDIEAPRTRQRPVRTVLAIDDSRATLEMLGEQLSRRGFFVVQCTNGGEALDLLAARGVDLVLLDMVMPGLTGLHVLAEIRANHETADLPVIMLTGHNDAAAAVEALATGADDLLAKPVAIDLLAARIERTIDRAQRIAELKRSNAMLDARIATRAIELGEARTELAERREECRRLTESIAALNARLSVSI